MPRELVTVQVGQCGNQLGCRLLDLMIHEHLGAFKQQQQQTSSSAQHPSSRAAQQRNATATGGSPFDPSALDSLQTVFQLFSTTPNRAPNPQTLDELRASLGARTVAIDMEEGVLKAMMRGPLRDVLRSCHVISDTSGAGNNWAVGHLEYGDRHGEDIIESVRHTVEACDSIQAFLMLHSLSGGTGSGLGSRVLGLLEEEFPDVARFATVVMPSRSVGDVVTAPYNTCFALRELVEHADCILPIDNDALARVCDKASGTDRVKRGAEALMGSNSNSSSSSAASSQLQSGDYNVSKATKSTGAFDQMNAIAAQMLSNLTCGVRFPGPLNLDINDIITNMVPYPRLSFLMASLSPLSGGRFDVGGGGGSSASGTSAASRAVDQMFSSVLDPDHALVDCDYQRSTVLCSAFVCRGSDVDVGDVSRNIPRVKDRMKRIWWNADGCKTAVCSQPPVGFPRSMIALQNNCAMGGRIEESMGSFAKLWTAKSHAHHYQKYLEASYFDDTLTILGDVVSQYREMDQCQAPARQPSSLRDMLRDRRMAAQRLESRK